MICARAVCVCQARDNLGTLGQEELQQFQDIIDMENPDLYKWLTGQTPVPEEVCAAAGSLVCVLGAALRFLLPFRPLACSQVGNPLLVRLCVDLKEAMEPKVTVKSVGGFEGKVWE